MTTPTIADLYMERIFMLEAAYNQERDRADCLERERDAAREDAAQLRALIKHYTTAPELEERLRGWDVLCQIGQANS